MKKSIFITGSEGFIGSHIVEKLIKKNFNINALVLYNSFGSIGNLELLPKKYLKKINIIFGNLQDGSTYEKYLHKNSYVINSASLISIPYSYRASFSYFQNNLLGAHTLFNLCLKKKVKKVIHFSTSEIYGTPKKIPIDEETPLNPQSPYAASKASVDKLAKSFFYSYNLPVTILRPFNNFGPRQSRRAVIPEIICQSLKKNIIELGDINTKRDFLYVEDTVDAVLKVINKNKINGEEINIGSGKFYKISEVIEFISQILNKKIIIKINKKKLRPSNSEVRYLLCNPKKAKKLLNWKPSCNNKAKFIEKLKSTIKHYSENYRLYNVKFYD